MIADDYTVTNCECGTCLLREGSAVRPRDKRDFKLQSYGADSYSLHHDDHAKIKFKSGKNFRLILHSAKVQNINCLNENYCNKRVINFIMDKLVALSGILFFTADIFAIGSLANPDWIVTSEAGMHFDCDEHLQNISSFCLNSSVCKNPLLFNFYNVYKYDLNCTLCLLWILKVFNGWLQETCV
jgi:hypothetical protein